MFRRRLLFLVALLASLPALAPLSALADPVVVPPLSPGGWSIVIESGTGAGSFVSGPATPPLGSGSARMTTATMNAGVLLGAPLYGGTKLADITALSYSTYVATASTSTAQVISLQLNFDNDVTDGDTTWKGRLVFEPYYTETITKGVWQTWNTLTQGRWWFTNGTLAATCGIGTPCTWNAVKTAFPSGGINAGDPGVGFKAGSGWPIGFDGNVDGFTIGISGVDTEYDFDVPAACTTTCYVDAVNGNDLNGGSSAADAKKTIQAALNSVSEGGTVHVLPGTYTEQVTLSQSVSLVGDDGAEVTIIKAPALIPIASSPDSTIVKVAGADTEAEISGFTISGPGPTGCGSIDMGIFVRDGAHANIHDNVITDIRDSTFSGCQNGAAIVVGRVGHGTSGSADIIDNEIKNYQKTGIIISNSESDATIEGNTVTGAGPTGVIAQNGIQVSGGAHAIITGNTVSGHSYAPFTAVSTGMLFFGAESVEVNGNAVSENQIGIYFLETPGSADSNLIDASASGTGSPAFWGIVVDDPPPGLAPSPHPDNGEVIVEDPIDAFTFSTLDNPLQSVSLTNNELRGDDTENSVGIEVDTGFGPADIALTASNNIIEDWGYGIAFIDCLLGEYSGCTLGSLDSATITHNSISSNLVGLDATLAPAEIDATDNWWGAANGPSPIGGGDAMVAGDFDVHVNPWLCDNSDEDPDARGFQPDPLIVCGPAAPETTIESSPAAATSSSNATFTFSGSAGPTPVESLTYECNLDNLGWEACSSPKTYTALAAGSHTFEVRTKDPGDNVDPTPDSFTWTIDSVAPDTFITSGPNGTVSSTTVQVNFNGEDNAGGSGIAELQCSLDSGTWTPCTSPKTYSGLTEGHHTIRVRAVDAAGNVDPTPASRTFIVDTSPPNTTITNAPSAVSNVANPSFSFNGTDAGSGVAGFECKLDSGPWGACSSPKNVGSLGSGNHTFQVRAKDATGAVDPSPAVHTWLIDFSAPNTTLQSKPASVIGTNSASFTFSGTDSGSGLAGFECKLDTGAWQNCSSPRQVTALSHGSHTFAVRAKDKAGNVDASPATYTWRVDLTAPDTTITSAPANNSAGAKVTFKFSGTDQESGISGFECKLDSGAWSTCASGQTYIRLANGQHTFMVRAKNKVGLVDATPATYTWRVGAPPR